MSDSEPFTVVARLDGVLVPPTLTFLRADDLGVLHGDGVFETLLAVAGSPRDLDEHLDRLIRSAKAIDLDIPGPEAWRTGARTAIAGWGGGREMVLRLVATRGPEPSGVPTCYALGTAVSDSARTGRSGVRVILLDSPVAGYDVIPETFWLTGVKTLSYATNMAALRHARQRDADDAIFVAQDGSVLEGPTSTVVLARGRTLVTPRRDAILDGITARRLFTAAEAAGWKTAVERVTAEDLRAADAVFLTSSVRLLAPVTAIDGEARELDEDLVAELAGLLQVPDSERVAAQ